MRLDHTILPAEAGRRAGRLSAAVFRLSQGDLSRLKREGGLLLDGVPVRQVDRVRSGQRLSVLLADAQPGPVIDRPDWLVHEDTAFRVIDKPPGLATMASREAGDTLEARYTDQLGQFRPVNRLDKGTGGLMVCATNGYFQHVLSAQLHSDRMIREYLAVVEGNLERDTGKIDLPIARADPSGNRRCIAPEGKQSVTCYRVLYRSRGRTLVRLRLLTGRTHQIRVHMAAVGHPICGDYLYGTALPEMPGYFALHSAYLFLTHPLNGETLFFRSRPPTSWSQLLSL